MADTQSASMDACHSPADDVAASPSTNFRRSISIFSRRGTETPEPVPTFVAQAAMMSSKPMTARQKSWISRTKSACGSPRVSRAAPPKTPNGTILHAVPQAKLIEMTALEEEMATSPNEEILSAISEHGPTWQSLTRTDSRPLSPVLTRGVRSKSTNAVVQRSESSMAKDSQSRIGVWVDGVVQWEESAMHAWTAQDADFEHTGFHPVRPAISSGAGESYTGPKPHLSVVIPLNEPIVNDKTVSTIIHPMPRRPIVSVAPSRILSKSTGPPPSIILNTKIGLPPKTETDEPAVPISRPRAPLYVESHRSRPSVSSSSDQSSLDEDSNYSGSSSVTSISTPSTPELPFHLSPSKMSLVSPDQAGVFDDQSIGRLDLNKDLPPTPSPPPPARAPPQLPRSSRITNVVMDPDRLQPVVQHGQSRSMSELDKCDAEFMRSVAPRHYATSPTLSQAEQDVHVQLSQMDGCQQTLVRKDSVRDVMQPPLRAPTIPKRSRKRDWHLPKHQAKSLATLEVPSRRRSEAHVKADELHQKSVPLRKAVSVAHHGRNSPDSETPAPPMPPRRSSKRNSHIGEAPNMVLDQAQEDLDELSPTLEGGLPSNDSANSAEEVLLTILASLKSMSDLFNTAIINKGMYRVYKENEMDLLRAVNHNQSPAAWELREWCPPKQDTEGSPRSSISSSQLEHTPLTYVRSHLRDEIALEGLKKLILKSSPTCIRRETTFALSTPTHPNAQRFNNAFWRIWCFCKIFGCQKNREEDITGQLDWLKGGLLAENQGCVATVSTNFEFDMSSVLLSAPDHFARGNDGGLSAAQLFDMTEIWTCLNVLLQPYSGRVEQARKYGVFDHCDNKDIDEDEEKVLEEWIAYVLTLGPSVVLDMALLASDKSSAAGFAFAQQQGWTDWSPPLYNGSRSSFFKEPVAKSYEEQVSLAHAHLMDPIEREQREMSRRRVAIMAKEIRLRRQSSEYKRLPLIDMHNERAMSIASRRSSASAASSRAGSTSGGVGRGKRKPVPQRVSALSSSAATPRASSSILWRAPASRPNISPIIEERVLSSLHSRAAPAMTLGCVAENTSEVAVQKIVAMGFDVTRAREALKVTDTGRGLRIDRAVEYLLRLQE